MTRWLVLLQFPLLYVPTMVLGLVVYGSDFAVIEGRLYLIPLLVIPLLHQFKRYWLPLLLPVAPRMAILFGGIFCALLAYRDLHFAFWDEHSLSQAIYLSALGLFSYLASICAGLGTNGQSPWQNAHVAISASVLVIGLIWLGGLAYPLFNIFAIACLLALGVCWFNWRQRLTRQELEVSIAAAMPATNGVMYLIFLLFMELGIVAWDFQVDTSWAAHFALTFVGAALVIGLLAGAPNANQLSQQPVTSDESKVLVRMAVPLAILFVLLNSAMALIWPSWVINLWHALLIGLGLGLLLPQVLVRESALLTHAGIKLSVPVLSGMAVGYLFYANLTYAGYRALFLLPVILMFNRVYQHPRHKRSP